MKPYVHERSLEYVSVALPEELKTARDRINQLLDDRLDTLRELSSPPPRERLSMRELHGLNAQIQTRIGERDSAGFAAASLHAELMKLRHALTLSEAQGSMALTRFLEKIALEGMSGSGSKASRHLAEEPAFQDLLATVPVVPRRGPPKGRDRRGTRPEATAGPPREPDHRLRHLPRHRPAARQPPGRYRDRVRTIRRAGQEGREKGLTQKKQIAALQRFRDGEFRVLIATSVGEEGLDVPSTDLVIFYEAVPSEIRSIQRKGRTGRGAGGIDHRAGDEGHLGRDVPLHLAVARTVHAEGPGADADPRRPGPDRLETDASPAEDPLQQRLAGFLPDGPAVVADDRETSSRVVEALRLDGAALEIAHLENGDYAIGDRILVERKTARDFVDTLVDRDLLGQLRSLADAAPKPVLIIEGGDLYSHRKIHPNAIRGALAAIAIDMGVTLLYSADERETADLLLVLARREEGGRGERKAHPRKTRRPVREQQEYVLSAFPDVGPRTARALLEAFGSLIGVLTADPAALESVPGVGAKTAARLHEFVRQGY